MVLGGVSKPLGVNRLVSHSSLSAVDWWIQLSRRKGYASTVIWKEKWLKWIKCTNNLPHCKTSVFWFFAHLTVCNFTIQNGPKWSTVPEKVYLFSVYQSFGCKLQIIQWNRWKLVQGSVSILHHYTYIIPIFQINFHNFDSKERLSESCMEYILQLGFFGGELLKS